MEFENANFGTCKLLLCDYKKGACLIEIENKNRTMPFVVTTRILKYGTWAKAEYYSTIEKARENYISMISEGNG